MYSEDIWQLCRLHSTAIPSCAIALRRLPSYRVLVAQPRNILTTITNIINEKRMVMYG